MIDQLEELEGLLTYLPDAIDRRRLGDRLTQSMTTLQNADHNIERIAAVIELADLTGMTSGGAGQVVEKLKEEAFEVGQWLETASSDEELRDATYEYDKVLLRSLANCEINVRNHWQVSAAQQFRPLVALGELLQRINVRPDLGKRLAETGRRALGAHQTGSAKALCAEVRALTAEQQALQEERAELMSEGEIGGFITAVAENKATLEMVTPKVQQWLSENGALNRFAITPRLQGSAGGGGG
jgi:hypothetical protein